MGFLPDDVEAAFGRALLALLRHEAGRMRLQPLRQRDHFFGRAHLEIERPGQFGSKALHVGIADMAPVLAQMGGDAVGAGGDGEMGGPDRIGQGAAARVSHRGDMVDIDAKTQPIGHDALPLCSLSPA